jgi:hypothetical protein
LPEFLLQATLASCLRLQAHRMVQLRERRNRKDFELVMWNASERSCVSWPRFHARYLIVEPINQRLHNYTQRSVDTAQYLKDWTWSGFTALPRSGSLVSAILLSLTSQGRSLYDTANQRFAAAQTQSMLIELPEKPMNALSFDVTCKNSTARY